MKSLIYILVTSLLIPIGAMRAAETPTPVPTLAAADFAPDGRARLILRTDVSGREYVRVETLDTTSLPPEAQAAIASGLAWLGAQLGEGYDWTEISLTRIADGIPAAWSEIGPEDDPETWTPTIITPASDRIVAAIYGSHPDLGNSVIPQGALTLPPELQSGLLAIWTYVESLAQAGALPTPTPEPTPEE